MTNVKIYLFTIIITIIITGIGVGYGTYRFCTRGIESSGELYRELEESYRAVRDELSRANETIQSTISRVGELEGIEQQLRENNNSLREANSRLEAGIAELRERDNKDAELIESIRDILTGVGDSISKLREILLTLKEN